MENLLSQCQTWIWVFGTERKLLKPIWLSSERSSFCNRTSGFVNNSAYPGIVSLPKVWQVYKNRVLHYVGIQKSRTRRIHSLEPLKLYSIRFLFTKINNTYPVDYKLLMSVFLLKCLFNMIIFSTFTLVQVAILLLNLLLHRISKDYHELG